MTAKIWEHWFTYYVNYYNEDGDCLGQNHFDTFDKALEDAKRWAAFVI